MAHNVIVIRYVIYIYITHIRVIRMYLRSDIRAANVMQSRGQELWMLL
jgi:hypothetical protein